jgi:hypothetical protein
MKHLTLLPLCALLVGYAVAADSIGAVIQSANCNDNAATVTVTNQSKQDITGFSVAITTVLAGRTVHWEHAEDYGPMLTDKESALHPQQSMTFSKPLDPNKPCSQVDAKVTVVIYRDGTAEAAPGAASRLQHIITVRQRIAKTLHTTADILEASLQQPRPEVQARAQLRKLLEETKHDNDEGDMDLGYLGGALDLADKSVQAQDQRQFLKDNIQRLRAEAIAFSEYAQVRRVQ